MISKSVTRVALLALGCGLMCLAATTTLVAQPVDPFGKLPKRTAEEWQKLYPFQSVADRLAYETNAKPGTPPPVLSTDAAKALDAMERAYLPNRFGDVRRESLKKLHSAEVNEFITREGNGLARMPSPSPRFLELAKSPTLPLGKVNYPDSALADDPRVTLPEKGIGIFGPSRLPSRESLSALHSQSSMSFLLPGSLGYVRKKQEVAGFDPHQFRFAPGMGNIPVLEHEQNKVAGKVVDRWVLRKLELVGLLKHERPTAYVSAQLPRMEDLKNAPTRELDAFETAALRRLQAGEDAVTEETLNRIRMVGAVRAGNACLECHNVQRGQLLGAFSYELLRDPLAKQK